MFEPNLFDYSVFELGLPDGQYTMFLMRINKETGEKQEHHARDGGDLFPPRALPLSAWPFRRGEQGV